MKCPYCHHEVPPGTLFCPRCLTEVPWVKEFDTVEQQLLRLQLEEQQIGTEEAIEDFERRNRSGEKRPRDVVRRFWRSVRSLVRKYWLLFLLVGSVLIILDVTRQMRSFPNLYNRAESAFSSANYEKALSYLADAIDQRPDDYKANYLIARTQQALGDYSASALVLTPMLQEYPDASELYLLMAENLCAMGEDEKLHELFRDCDNPEILTLCADYICEPPTVSVIGGTYTSEQTIELSGDYEAIYFTVNGAKPTLKSFRYVRPITVTNGRTVLKAFGVNKLGIASEVTEQKYIISTEQPNAPKVSPATGIYHEDTKIEITVPEGCNAYYAFDEVPTTSSTLYERPIQMPMDDHVFYAILVSADGQVSEPASVEYYLEY